MLANVALALLVGVAYVAGDFPNPRLLHLILVFALCSTPIIDIDGLNGRYALLGLFMLVYFVSYGVGDLSNLLAGSEPSGSPSPQGPSAALSKTEAVILVGGIMLVLGYRLSVLIVSASGRSQSPRDSPQRAIMIVGLLFRAV